MAAVLKLHLKPLLALGVAGSFCCLSDELAGTRRIGGPGHSAPGM
jgi:hypothetical protein